jgi:replicative DNA helicase
MATTRYRRRLDTASSTIVEKACEAETENKILLACCDDLLDQLYELKNKLLCVSQIKNDSPAMQACMQAEVQRIRREWGARL